MRRILLSVLLISFVLAGAAGLSNATQAQEAVSELRADWTAAKSLPPGAAKTVEMGQVRKRAESLAQQYPKNSEVQTWVSVVVSSHRNLLRQRSWRG